MTILHIVPNENFATLAGYNTATRRNRQNPNFVAWWPEADMERLRGVWLKGVIIDSGIGRYLQSKGNQASLDYMKARQWIKANMRDPDAFWIEA